MGLWDFPLAPITPTPTLSTKALFGKIPYSIERRFSNIDIRVPVLAPPPPFSVPYPQILGWSCEGCWKRQSPNATTTSEGANANVYDL